MLTVIRLFESRATPRIAGNLPVFQIGAPLKDSRIMRLIIEVFNKTKVLLWRAIRAALHSVLVKPQYEDKQERGRPAKGKMVRSGNELCNGLKVVHHVLYRILQPLFTSSYAGAIRTLPCLVLLIFIPSGSSQNAKVLAQSGEPVYSVVSPLGESTIKMTAMAPRLKTLAGKTVCMVWNGAFKSHVTLPTIGEVLKKQYPDVKIVPYTDMPEAFLPEPPGAPKRQSEALQELYRRKGCDAVISGNGG